MEFLKIIIIIIIIIYFFASQKMVFFQRVQFLNLQKIEFIQKEEDSLEKENCHHHHHHHHNHLYNQNK
jgi:hypothetical protein